MKWFIVMTKMEKEKLNNVKGINSQLFNWIALYHYWCSYYCNL